MFKVIIGFLIINVGVVVIIGFFGIFELMWKEVFGFEILLFVGFLG